MSHSVNGKKHFFYYKCREILFNKSIDIERSQKVPDSNLIKQYEIITALGEALILKENDKWRRHETVQAAVLAHLL